MAQADTIQTPKTAGFVDRGYNHSRKQNRLAEEEAEIARLEAAARGEEVVDTPVEVQKEQTADVQEAEVKASEEVDEEDDSNLSREERTFKKRYGDMRKHLAEKEKEWNAKFEALQNNTQQVRPPKTDEDIEAWAKEYPDVASLVETIAMKKAKELFDRADSRLKDIDKQQAEVHRNKAENKIRSAHEDFDQLRDSDDFHDWVEEQPKWVQQALYDNMDDPDSVIRVIDLYKVDNNLTPAAKKSSNKAAASAVSKGSRASVDLKGQQGTIKESDVARMSSKEFEEKQDAISKAMQTGKFVYDVSGSAR